jgi:hypothetical protein
MTTHCKFARSLLAALALSLPTPAIFAQDDDAPSTRPLTAEVFAPRIEELSKILGKDDAGLALSRYLALSLVKSPSASLARDIASARALVLRRAADSFTSAERALELLANPLTLRGFRGFGSVRSGLIEVIADKTLAIDDAKRLAVLEREAGRSTGDSTLDETFLAGNLKALNVIARYEGARSSRLERAADLAMRSRAGQWGALEALAQEVEGLNPQVGARLRSTHRVVARPVPEPTEPPRP